MVVIIGKTYNAMKLKKKKSKFILFRINKMNTSLTSIDNETKVNNENQTQINSSKNTLDSAENFDNYTKLLNASAKLAEETKHLGTN